MRRTRRARRRSSSKNEKWRSEWSQLTKSFENSSSNTCNICLWRQKGGASNVFMMLYNIHIHILEDIRIRSLFFFSSSFLYSFCLGFSLWFLLHLLLIIRIWMKKKNRNKNNITDASFVRKFVLTFVKRKT